MFRTCGYFNHAPNGIANSVWPIPYHAVPGQLPETVEEAEEAGAGGGAALPFSLQFWLMEKLFSEHKA